MSTLESETIVDADAPRFRGGMLRALFSAAVFGAIGAYFGKWLGKRGNAEGSHMAEPIMQWSMGAFWAVLAAYASLKSDERVDQKPAPQVSTGVSGFVPHDTSGLPPDGATQPHSLVAVASAKNEGMLQEKALQLAPQK
jgi:hypothetical protein